MHIEAAISLPANIILSEVGRSPIDSLLVLFYFLDWTKAHSSLNLYLPPPLHPLHHPHPPQYPLKLNVG